MNGEMLILPKINALVRVMGLVASHPVPSATQTSRRQSR